MPFLGGVGRQFPAIRAKDRRQRRVASESAGQRRKRLSRLTDGSATAHDCDSEQTAVAVPIDETAQTVTAPQELPPNKPLRSLSRGAE